MEKLAKLGLEGYYWPIMTEERRLGKTPDNFAEALNVVEKKIKEGEIRTEINCLENIQGFFEMARRMYVENGEADIKDAELGIHMGSCECPLCQKCARAYFEILRPSKESDGPQIKARLEKLALEIFLGTPRPELDDGPAMFFDAKTKLPLYETGVTDITDKVTGKKRAGRKVLLCYVPTSSGTFCVIKDTGVAFTYNIADDFKDQIPQGFKHAAKHVGIEENLFKAIILANSPKAI